MTSSTAPDPKLDLVLDVVVPVTPRQLWRAYTTPDILIKWFCPVPWKVVECEIDLRPGGVFRTVMQSPEGENFPNVGCFLEIVENEKLVWTDALLPGFRPVVSPASGAGLLFSATILLEPSGDHTHYTAIVRHKDEEDRKRHEEMGFHEGWGITLKQLAEVMKREPFGQ